MTTIAKPKMDKEYILKTVHDQDVKFIRFWFTDILGFLKSFAITRDELKGAFEEGMGFDGSSIEGFARIDESDMMAMPDPNTFQILPWYNDSGTKTARMICDIQMTDGTPYEGDPRYILKRNIKKATELGYTYYVGPELEYFYFEKDNNTNVLDKGGYFDLTHLDIGSSLRRETVLDLEKFGIPVEYSHHEVAHSQHEIDLRYSDALTMADNAMTYRLVVKEIARKNGVYATFMPKPIAGMNGSGMHVHQSLFKGSKNAFFDANDDYLLSDVAKAYIAGILRHSKEFTAVTNQWVNSYKRLVPGYEAPVYIAWARKNRSPLVRIPMYRQGKETATRLELRSPDPAANPYLAFSVMLAAGLKGIEENYKLPAPIERDIFEMTEKERQELKIENLPGSLLEATLELEKSELMKEALGDHVFHTFIENKKIEWSDYARQISQFELDNYLPLL